MIVHLLEKHEGSDKDFVVTIGSENDDTIVKDISIISATYDADGVKGRVGIIGPRRLDYAKVIPLVDHVAKLVAKMMRG